MATTTHGNVVIVDFPATGGQPGKRRPAVVVFDSGDADFVVARLTTKTRTSNCDVTLGDWAAAGLRAPSVLRLHKLLTIEKSLVAGTMGTLSAKDRQSLSASLNSMFGNW